MARSYTDARTLAATVLPDARGPYEVTLQRQGLEGDQAKVAAAQAATKQKAEEARAAALKMPVFDGGFVEHTPALSLAVREYEKALGDLEYNRMLNPNNPDFDPAVIGSTANRQLWLKEQDTKRIFENSNNIKDQVMAFNARLNDPNFSDEFTPEYVEAYAKWQNSKEALYDGAQPPRPETFWDSQKWVDNELKNVKPDITGWEQATQDGYITGQVKEQLTTEKLKAQAVAGLLEPSTRAYREFSNAYEALPEAERKKVDAEAKKNGLTTVQQMGFMKLRNAAYEKSTQTLNSDPTFNAKWGSGWGNDELAADRWVKMTIGAAANSPELFTPVEQFYSGEFPQGTKGFGGAPDVKFPKDVNAVMQGYKGQKVAKIDGKEMYATVVTRNDDGTLSLYAAESPGETLFSEMKEILRTPQEDWASDVTEMMTEANDELKKPAVEKKLREYGVVTESGYIKSGKPKVLTAQQIAEQARNSGKGASPKKYD